MRRSFLQHILVLLAFSLPVFSLPIIARAQIQLALLPGDSTTFVTNPDSIMVDTAAPLFAQAYYARRWYWLVFSSHIFTFSPQQADTASAISWNDILPTFAAIRQGFDSLQQRFGPYRITKVTQDSLLYGTPGSIGYYLAFDNYVSIDSVTAALNAVPGVQAAYIWRGGSLATLPSDRALLPLTEWNAVVADPSTLQNSWPAHFRRLGWHWNHYRQKSPMAWEITMGTPDVVIAFDDNFIGPPSNHPDAAAGNHRDDWKNIFGWSRNRRYVNDRGEDVALFYNWLLYPTALCWADPADPTNGARDVRVLAVGAVSDGTLHECAESFEGRALPEVSMSGPEQFHPAFNFGPGKEKFSSNSDPTARIAAKEFAYMDIVVPTGRLVATDGTPDTPDHRELFHPHHEGTSEAAPALAGVVGLMLSINPGMGTIGSDVQRRVYNAVTFTADKIPDWKNFNTEEREASWIYYATVTDPATGEPLSDEFGNPIREKKTHADWMPDRMRFADVNPRLTGPLADGEPIQYDYVEQTNDPLHRWWAQRVGFGRLNAYRAVAHAIPLKGNPVWNVSQTLFNGVSHHPVNEQGVRLMHFGAYNNAGELVLENRGDDLPGENFNNQGSTWINGTGTELIVPENALLAIDGLVKTEDPTGGNSIRTSRTGNILITGYLEDVRVVGNVRVDDLIVRGSTSEANGSVEINDSEITAEVYGNVRLVDYGTFRVNKGRLLMQPGSTIAMEGTKDLHINEGATLEMTHASTITGAPGRRLVVESGCTLRVKSGSHVELLTDVLVKAGGNVLIEPDAVVSLNHFTVERDGELIVKEGARLRLNDRAENLVNGRLYVLGTAAKRAVISGRVDECCTRICTHVIDRASIRVQDEMVNPADRTSCNLRLSYAEFSSVPLRAVNVALYSLWFCNFTAQRSLLDKAAQRVLLDLQLTDPNVVNASFNPPAEPPLRESARLIACNFSDGEGPIPLPRGTFTHTVSGLRLQRMKRAWISSCNFHYLRTGIETVECDSVGIDVSEFFAGDFGLADNGSVLRLCSNTFRGIECGALLVGSGSSWIFSNTFRQSRVGIVGLASYASHFVRGNTFKDYQYSGILLDKTGARLDVSALGRTAPAYNLWGRNTFHCNGTGTIFGPVSVNADIRLRDPFAAAPLSCGFNRFAQHTTWHLYADVPKNSYPVAFNQFRDPDGPLVRAFNITWYGAPLNTAATLPGCTPAIGEYCTPDPPPPTPGIDPVYIADDSWPDLPWNDPYLVEAFNRARWEMMDPAVPLSSRLLKMRNALEAAIAGDSVHSRLQLLRADYTVLAVAPYNPAPLRSAAQLLLGQVAERLGDQQGAASAYQLVVNHHTTQSEALPASWHARALAATSQDTTFSPVYDSLMNDGRDRLLTDVRQLILFPLPAQPTIPEQGNETATDTNTTTEPAILRGNTPNPFIKETTIRYWLAEKMNVRLVVTNVQGKEIAVLVDTVLEAGDHETTFTPGDLPSGVYFFQLDAGDQRYVLGGTLGK